MKKLNKILLAAGTVVATAAPIASVIACGSGDSSVVSWNPAAKNSAVLVGGTTGHDDKGFLQSTYDGLQDVMKVDNSKLTVYGEIKAASSADAEYQKAARSALINGAYSVWGAGYQYASFNGAEFSDKYPNREFFALDATITNESYQPIQPKANVTAFDFKGGESSFIAGIATGFYLTEHYSTFSADGLKVGTFGGQGFAPVKEMMQGFINGVKYFNNTFAADDAHKISVVKAGSTEADQFADGFQPSPAGLAKAQTLINGGADVIFPVAGGQVSQAVNAIKAATGKTIKLVGVDVDQASVFGADGGQYFIGSSLKNMRKVTHDLANALFNGVDLPTGFALHKQNHGTLTEGYVGVTNTGGFSENVTVNKYKASSVSATAKIYDLLMGTGAKPAGTYVSAAANNTSNNLTFDITTW